MTGEDRLGRCVRIGGIAACCGVKVLIIAALLSGGAVTIGAWTGQLIVAALIVGLGIVITFLVYSHARSGSQSTDSVEP